MLLGSLSVDIGTHDLKRCAADTADKIGAVPELRFLVESRKVFGKAVSGTAGAGRLEVVDQYRDIQRRMDIDQQVHMIGFPAKFLELAAPGGEAIRKRLLEIIKQFRRQRLRRYFVTKTICNLILNTA